MSDRPRGLITKLLRLPPPPQPPAGQEGSARTFRAARNYYYYALFRWGLKQTGAVIGIVLVLTFGLPWEWGRRIPWDATPVPDMVARWFGDEDEPRREKASRGDSPAGFSADRIFWYLELVGAAGLLLQMPFTFLLVRLDYELRWYLLTDRSLRIREGVASVREMTLTFANVQDLEIRQGPIQRLLGISDLRVRTAGGGGGSGQGDSARSDDEKETSMHVGYLRGVSNAREIRELVLARLGRHRDAGLGDLDDHRHAEGAHAAGPDVAPAVLDAARAVLVEARALRETLRRGAGA